MVLCERVESSEKLIWEVFCVHLRMHWFSLRIQLSTFLDASLTSGTVLTFRISASGILIFLLSSFLLSFLLFSFLLFRFCFLFWDKVPLCSPDWPGTCHVNQACLKLRDLSAFVSSAGIRDVHHYELVLRQSLLQVRPALNCWPSCPCFPSPAVMYSWNCNFRNFDLWWFELSGFGHLEYIPFWDFDEHWMRWQGPWRFTSGSLQEG